MSDFVKCRELRKQLAKRVKLENKREKYNKKLKNEETLTAFQKVKKAFSFPFKKDAFGDMLSAMLVVLCSIIFASCTGFIAIAIVFCALVDALYIPLYGISYPFLLLYFFIFKGLRIKILDAKLRKVREKLSSGKSSKALKREIAQLEKTPYRTTSGSSSNIRDTEYFKAKSQEYFDGYMGTNTDNGGSNLPDYATDTTLDLHPGGY